MSDPGGLRRIHHLRLQGTDETRLARARRQLEEAFRLASLPGLPPAALVRVRRLALDAIDPDRPPTILAGLIDARVRELAARAVCADEAEYPEADVVWFSDALQALTRRLILHVDKRPATAWYWRHLPQPPAVPAPDDVLVRTLAASLDTPAGTLAPARLLDGVLRRVPPAGLMAVLDDGLTSPLARRLLHVQGQTPARVSAGRVPAALRLSAPAVSTSWRALIVLAARHWGGGDLRTRWVALQALFAHRPARIAGSDVLQRLEVSTWLASWATGWNVPAGAQPADVTGGEPATSDGGAGPEGGKHRARRGRPVVAPVVQQRPATVAARQGAPAGVEATPLRLREQGALSAGPQPGLVASRHAGLALLISLWSRLGMARLLADNEALLAADLPLHLLRDVARRLAVAGDDPVLALFDDLNDEPTPPASFIAPASWWRLAAEQGGAVRRHPLDGDPRGVVLLEPRGRWRLFCGEAGRAEALAAENGLSLSSATAALAAPDVGAVVRDLRLLGACLLRRLAGLSLRGLVCREGRVAITRTHWDAVFDLQSVDLRLRRAGLDCDPGWVPWLGRVVQFHYRDEEVR